MIEVKGVSKYLRGNRILDDVTINVNKGSIYGLIGPNGAGKTTLIKTMVGIYEQEKGDIFIDGEKIRENTKIKSRLGYVSDFQYFYPGFKVGDIVDFYRNTYPMWNENRFKDLRKLFKLDDNKKIKNLSKGMKTQLSILLNLSIMPKVLILDEPTSGLDPVIRRKVLNMLVEEVSVDETTIFISTHNLGELEQICDHSGIIHEGKILLEDSIDNLKEKVRKIQVAFKEDIPKEIKEHKDVLKIENKGIVYHIVVKNGVEEVMAEIQKYDPVLLETVDMTLEEIFIYKIGGEGYVFEDIAL